MKKVFAVEMKRAINIGWIISILGVCFSICFDSWNDLMRALTSHTGSIHYFFWNSSWGGVCRTYFLPIFAAIPFATSFCKEYKNHSLSFIVSREGKKRYCTVKYVINALCGGVTVAIGTGVLLLALSFVLPMADSTFQDAVVSDRFHAWIALYHPFEYGMLEVWSGFLRGILWSSIALCVSAYISDPFVVLVSPYFVSFFIVQAYHMGNVVDRYRLDKLLTGNVIIQSSVHTVLICTIVVLLIVILFGILFRRTVLRRLEDGVFY